MEYLSDLHLHSRFARATSKQLDLPTLVAWAKTKGLNLIGIPDFTHPKWIKEIRDQIINEEGTGLYRLKDDSSEASVKMVFCTEISAIFSRGSKSHRIHLLVLAPSLKAVKEIIRSLSTLGKLGSDGRPVFGKDIVRLIRAINEACPKCILIPAHIWTPWYSLFGSRSGFDSLEEAFGEHADKIAAVETGMSSDPSMNWRVSALDNKNIVSFSDAHSVYTMGREATIFEGEFSWKGLSEALTTSPKSKAKARAKITGTVEFYPEEGKYHFTGHRKCEVIQSPEETEKFGELCPICSRALTVGVMHRVEQLADRSEEELKLKKVHGWIKSEKFERPPFLRIIPLNEVIAQALGIKGTRTKTVMRSYSELCKIFGSEWEVLTKAPIDGIEEVAGYMVAEAVYKNRVGDVNINPGFDGEYGIVEIDLKRPGKPKLKKKRSQLHQSRLFNP